MCSEDSLPLAELRLPAPSGTARALDQTTGDAVQWYVDVVVQPAYHQDSRPMLQRHGRSREAISAARDSLLAPPMDGRPAMKGW